MGDWWQALTGDLQIFYAIAFISSFFLLVQIALLAFGIGADVDIGDDDPSSGFLSIRTLTAFSFAFGWTGVLMKQADRSTALSVGVAIAAGLAVFLAVGFLWRSFAKLGESGSIDYQSAVGVHGTVYLTVAANRSKPGKVEVMVQGRLRVINALTESDESLPAQTAITVVGVVDPSTVLVAPH
ncbi:hypothetical protein [Candidatus Poriferisodalis sp.]|uniref:hypothetical protein n=1 Tax=Candidatus Poriferisodalis sp. TaxID=3101277 RepID=UPI003B5BCB1C